MQPDPQQVAGAGCHTDQHSQTRCMLVQSGRMQMQANIVTHTFFERVCMAAAMQLNQPKLQNKPKTAHNLDVTLTLTRLLTLALSNA